MVAIEPRDGAWATSRKSVLGRVEPQPEMVRMDRLGRRVRDSVRERWIVVDEGCWLPGRGLRHNERLDVESPDELLLTFALGVGLDVALVPREAKRPVGNLNHEEIKLRLRGKPTHVDIHMLDRPL